MFFDDTHSALRGRLFRQFAAFITEALEGLGSAMSAGGHFPVVGMM